MFRTTGFIAVLLAASVASAELSLVINGPEKALDGDLVVLNATGSVANGINWIYPPALEGKTIKLGEQLAFATRNPGTYTIYLYGTDGILLTDVSHTVVITRGDRPTDPDNPTEPDNPTDPEQPPGFSVLMQLSRDLSIALNDETTRAKLAMRLMSADFNGTEQGVQDAVESVIRKVFSERTRDNQDADWLNGWYIPILKQLRVHAQAGTIETVADYKRAMQSVANGLQNQSVNTPLRKSSRW